MNDPARRLLVLLPLAAAVPLALAAFAGLPEFGAPVPTYGARLAEIALAERQAENLSAAIIFDYRAVDTLGEQFVVFAVAIGVALLFRDVRGYPGGDPLAPAAVHARGFARSEGTAAAARLALPVVLVFGTYMTLHAHLTPGGGFQGGAILASGLLLVWLGASDPAWRAATPAAALDAIKGASATAFVAVGLLGLLAGGAFLENVLPMGERGSLASGGTIPVLNVIAGIGVAAGLAILFREFLAEIRPAGEDAA
jgi:multicomponent Na+:H+ antiporter subunit B